MKQQYNITEKILLVDNSDSWLIENIIDDSIIFIDTKYTWLDLSLLNLDKKDIRRVFEKFYILNNNEDTQHSTLVYDAIHLAYDEIIEKTRNLESNKILCDLLHKKYDKPIDVIVDFGCGTGFSPTFCNEFSSKTIGIDISRNMLDIAKINGYAEVYRPDEFDEQEIEIDAVLISYVFHLLDNPEETLLNLTKKIKPGGIISGNFFKNTNIKVIQDFFKKLNWFQEEIKVKSNYKHGKIFIFRKPKTSLPLLNIDFLLKNNSFLIESKIHNEIFTSLIKYNILPTFETIDDKYILQDDFNLFIKSFSTNTNKITSEDLTNKIYLSNNTYLKFSNKDSLAYQTNSVLKNTLMYLSDNSAGEISTSSEYTILENNTRIHTKSKNTYLNTKENLQFIQTNLENSKYELTAIKTYMGTKKNLSSFIISIINQFSNDKTKVIDLMSGTGVVASACSNYWETYASDLQTYSLILAEAQGQGFVQSSKDLIAYLKPYITKNLNELKKRNIELLNKEKYFLNSKIHDNIIDEYKEFISKTPYYSTDNLYVEINNEINERKKDNSLFPYVLFSSYFTNHYLGIAQSMEIDSIRYAIDQITDEKIKKFALAALLGSLAQFVSSYGGHVAQPKYTAKSIKKSNISKVIEDRSKIIIFDFFTRLQELEKHSEIKKYPIKSITGPWQNAIATLSKELDDNTIVYFDPPYTREEFGRYYHLYETLAKYNYPDSIGIGRTPNKAKGERYSTEFSSRNNNNIENAIVSIISKVLDNNWTCLWSYANNSVVNMIPVIQRVYSKFNKNIDVLAYATEHRHSTQGKKPTNEIIEYVIVFKKKKN